MKSHYDETAEHHEVHMPARWRELRDLVQETFGDIGPDGVIVDVGAGSGLGSVMLAEVSEAAIFSLEPNDTMRSMLVARLDTAGALDRVTVLAQTVSEGFDRLPKRVDGVTATHMLGHLTGAERTALLDWIAGSLAPGRSALLTVNPEVPRGGAKLAPRERQVGRFVYRATYHMPSTGQTEQLYEVLDEQQQVVRSLSATSSWQAVTAADVRAALEGHAVDVSEPQDGAVLVTKPA